MRSKYECLVGKQIGDWKVLSETEPKNHQRRFLCQCKCGTLKEQRGYDLFYGLTTKCHSCSMKEKQTWKKRKPTMKRCKACGKLEHYAKGYCRSCYNKARRGTL